MTTIINVWSPDTCSCVLHYSWDDTEPAETRQIIFFAAEKVCADHAGLVPAVGPTFMTVDNKKEERKNTIKDVLAKNRENNLKTSSRVKALKTNEQKQDLVAPVPDSIIEKEQAAAIRALNQHEEEVTARYDAILSTPFALVQEVYDCVLNENQKKNKAIDIVVQESTTITKMEQDGVTKSLKDEIVPEFVWTGAAPNRILELKFKDMKTKTDIKLSKKESDAVDNALGAGKVVLK